MNRYMLFCCLLVNSSVLLGQVSFTERTSDLLGNLDIRSTIAIAIDDINSDMHDDLIVLDRGKTLKTYTQTAPGDRFLERIHTNTAFGVDWSIVTGDLNNDGVPEIISSGNENGSAVLFADDGQYNISQNTPALYSQNSNLVDLDEDGFLDFFICNDLGENKTYLNNGSGGLTSEKIIDFKTSEDDDQSGNYSSIFTDIDGDGDLDLYIGKCKAGVSDPTDRRRINTLYINDGDGGYTESAEAYGLANGSQTWSVDAGDIDNDGDMDLIIANHDRTHDLMINRGGYFTRFDGLPDGVESFAYQSFFADFDNNGWLDIFITEPQNSYILYNQEMSFSLHELKVSGKRAFTGAVGDLNSDGFLDLYLGFAETFHDTGQRRDAIMINDKNSNNYIGINVLGTISNRDAIGAKILVYSNGRRYTREVTAGKSYGIMNTTNHMIGIGASSVVDSVVVKWPSGEVTAMYDLDVNSRYVMEEDGCNTALMLLPDLQICDGEAIDVSTQLAFDFYAWSTGSTDTSVVIGDVGSYSVTGLLDGCLTWSNIFRVEEQEDYSAEEIIIADQTVGCANESVSLTSMPGVSYTWSTGETAQTIATNEEGIYQVTVSTNCDTYISDPLDISIFNIDPPSIATDTVALGGAAVLGLDGDDVRWYGRALDRDPIGIGASFEYGPILMDTTFYAESVFSGHLGIRKLIPTVPLNGGLQSQYPANDTLPFTTFRSIFISSVSVRTQAVGFRTIEIWQDSRLLRSYEVNLQQGVNVIPLDIKLERGDYNLTTNADVNLANFGTLNPQLSYSQQFFGADKRIDGFLAIGESTVYGSGLTPYFFVWDVEYDLYYCAPRYPVSAYLDLDVGVDRASFRNASVFPNPSSGVLQVEGIGENKIDIEVLSTSGSPLLKVKGHHVSQALDISVLPTGMYLVRIIAGGESVYSALHTIVR